MCAASQSGKNTPDAGKSRKNPGKMRQMADLANRVYVLPCLWSATIMRTLFTGPPGKDRPHAPPPPDVPMEVAFLVPEA